MDYRVTLRQEPPCERLPGQHESVNNVQYSTDPVLKFRKLGLMSLSSVEPNTFEVERLVDNRRDFTP